MTKTQEELKETIDSWDQLECARFYKTAPSEHEIIQDPALFQYFMDRFKSLGGMTPEISKQLSR